MTTEEEVCRKKEDSVEAEVHVVGLLRTRVEKGHLVGLKSWPWETSWVGGKTGKFLKGLMMIDEAVVVEEVAEMDAEE